MRRLLARFGLQVLSIALALVLWFGVAGQKQAERSMRVALEFQNIPPALELMTEPTSSVDVRVRGPANAIAQLRSGDLIVLVDLSTARAGRRLFHLTPEEVVLPAGIQALHVQPATLQLTFEASIVRRVPVVPVVEGLPAPGFVAGTVSASPSEVEIVGPESVVRSVNQATTEPVTLTGARSRVRDEVTIGIAGDTPARLLIARDAVVTVEILPAPIERTVSGVSPAIRHLGKGLRALLSPSAVAVTVRGPGNRVRQLSPQAVPAWVDATGLGRGQYTLPVRVDEVQDYVTTASSPSSVRITIR